MLPQVALTLNSEVTHGKLPPQNQPVRRPCADLSVGREREAVPGRGLLIAGWRDVTERLLDREPISLLSAFAVASISPSKTFSDGSFLATLIANLICMLRWYLEIVTGLCKCDCLLVMLGVCLLNLLTNFVVGDAELAKILHLGKREQCSDSLSPNQMSSKNHAVVTTPAVTLAFRCKIGVPQPDTPAIGYKPVP